MKINLTARFFDTESAQSAAKRISDCGEKINEVRLYYDTENSDGVIANNILYDGYGNENKSKIIADYSSEFAAELGVYGEIRSDCLVKITADESVTGTVRSIIYNEGGYDVYIE